MNICKNNKNFVFAFSDAYIDLLFCTLMVSLTLGESYISMSQDNITQYVSGSIRTDLPDPLFYSTYIPVIYEIDIPKWNSSHLSIKWPVNFSTTCNEKDTFEENWKSMACPVVHYMYNVAQQFLETILDWQTLNSTLKSTKIDETLDCNEIRPHFNSYTLGMEETTDYLHEHLMNCPIGQVVYEKLNHKLNNLHMNSTLNELMLSKFIDEYVALDKNRVTGFNRFSAATNAYSSLQTLQFLEYIYISSKWTQAISTCGDGMIPYTLIPEDSLASTLKEVEQILAIKENKKYQLTLDADDLSAYYKSELADCVFTSKTYMVRILVPLKKAELEYKLSLMTPIPFLRHYGKVADICQYDHPSIPIVIEQHTSFAIPSSCEPGELCLVPDHASRPPIDYCLHALIRNSTQDIIDFCEIQCQYLGLNHLPYFRRLASDKYAILGQSNMDIFVNCDDQPFKVIYPPLPIGALEVTLPCSCQLVHQRDVLHSTTPCGNSELTLREILPIPWSSKANFPMLARPTTNNDDKKNDMLLKNSYDSDGSLRVKLYILSSVVLVLFFFNGLLILVIDRLNKRIMKLEKSNGHGGGNFFENPLQMHVRANDD